MRKMQPDLRPPELRPDILDTLRRLTDDELVSRVEALAKREHVDTALLVAHLAELDTRDVYLRAGFSSLFVYCRDGLGLSEHESYNRIEVARATRRFPVVLELLASGAVNLTTVRLLAPHLTPDNHLGVLESARGKKRTEVEEIVARLAPFPEVPPSIRKLPPPRPAYPPPLPHGPDGPGVPAVSGAGSPVTAGSSVSGASPAAASGGPPAGSWPSPVARPGTSPAATPPVPAHPTPYYYRQPSGEVTPLAPDRYRLQCTIAGATLDKLRLAQDMLRHAIPSGDEASLLDRAFTSLLVDLARTKFAAVENPQPPRGTAPGSRHIPAEVKRAVWVRDLGRCAFVGTDGRRCNERAFVEFHHVKPWSAGGEATVYNIQLRCRRHNGYEARVFFDGGRQAEGGGERETHGGGRRETDGGGVREPDAGVDTAPGTGGGSVVREAPASYGSERMLATREPRLVSKRVRMSASAGSGASRLPGRRASADEERARDSNAAAFARAKQAHGSEPAPDEPTRAAHDRAGRAARASAGRPAGRGRRPPPRRG
jgi:hypothetical protein